MGKYVMPNLQDTFKFNDNPKHLSQGEIIDVISKLRKSDLSLSQVQFVLKYGCLGYRPPMNSIQGCLDYNKEFL